MSAELDQACPWLHGQWALQISLLFAEIRTLHRQDLSHSFMPQDFKGGGAGPGPLLQLIVERMGLCVLQWGEQACTALRTQHPSYRHDAWVGAIGEWKGRMGCSAERQQSQKRMWPLTDNDLMLPLCQALCWAQGECNKENKHGSCAHGREDKERKVGVRARRNLEASRRYNLILGPREASKVF